MKTFRKSSLITSVALLLVAIVALGGATFAWFSANNKVSANDLTLTATSSKGLYIAETALDVTTAPENSEFKAKLDWTTDSTTLPPTSSLFESKSSPSFVTTSTTNLDGTWVDAAFTGVDANEDYIAKKIWLKADGTELVDIQVKLLLADAGQYARVAITDGTNFITATEDNANTVWGIETEDYEARTSATDTEDMTAIAPSTVTLEDLDLSTGKAYYVFIWFEGQDTDCYNANGGKACEVDLEFSIPTNTEG